MFKWFYNEVKCRMKYIKVINTKIGEIGIIEEDGQIIKSSKCFRIRNEAIAFSLGKEE